VNVGAGTPLLGHSFGITPFGVHAVAAAAQRGPEQCGLCGNDPAAGFATIGDTRYCHGDFDPEPTCYMRASPFYATGMGRTWRLDDGWKFESVDGGEQT
jgi:hypothetical protein